MFVYKKQKKNINLSVTKVRKRKPPKKSKDSLITTEQSFTSKIKSNKINQSRKITQKNKEFIEQLGFTLKK